MITIQPTLPNTKTWLRNRFGNEALIFLVLFALVIVLWLPRLDGPIDLRWDAGVYYVLGTSLAEAKGYRLLNEPGDIHATQYPPLLPAIVAAHQWVLGRSDPLTVGYWLRRSFFLVFAIYIFAIYWMARKYLPSKYAFLATLVCLLGLQTSFLSDLCVPETMFGLATILFILCNKSNGRIADTILAAFLAMASYALRSVGIALFAAWVAESLLNRKFKKAAVRLMFLLIPLLCWQSYIYYVESGKRYEHPTYEYQRADYLFYNVSYAKNMSLKDPFRPELGRASFGDLTYRFLRNLTKVPKNLGETISAPKGMWAAQWARLNKWLPFSLATMWPAYLAPIFLGLLILGGMGLQLSNRQWIAPFYILFYLAVISFTPWPEQFSRYMAPLIPFLALSISKLLLTLKEECCKILRGKWKVTGLAVIGSIVFLILIQQSLTLICLYTRWHQEVNYEDQNGNNVKYRLFFYSDSYQALDTGLDWLKKRAKPGDVVAATMPQWIYLRTGLKAVMPPFESDPIKAQHLLDSVPVRYVIIDEIKVEGNFTGKYASPLVRNSPKQWKMVYAAPEAGFEIYQRLSLQTSSVRSDSTNNPFR